MVLVGSPYNVPTKFQVLWNVYLVSEVKQTINIQLLCRVYHLTKRLLEFTSGPGYRFFLVSIAIAFADIREHILLCPF